jgi:hypothetical protein
VTTTTEHLTHGLMLGFPLYVFALLFAAEWRRTADAELPWSLRLAALSSAGAGVVHAVVTPHHTHEAPLLGWFFALLCAAQLAWVVVLLLRPVRAVVVAGVLGNVAVVLLWAWTRAVGIPLGVAGGARQRFTPWDLSATGLEVVLVLAGLAWVYSATGASSSPRVAASKWDRSTTRNSPPPRKVSLPSGSVPSQATNSLRPSRRSTLATRS